jgi:ATP synthase protein I
MGQDERPPQPAHSASADSGAWDIVAYLLSGMLVWGGAGWLLDRWLGVNYFLLIGLLLGTGLALYIVYMRYGRTPEPPSDGSDSDGEPDGSSR